MARAKKTPTPAFDPRTVDLDTYEPVGFKMNLTPEFIAHASPLYRHGNWGENVEYLPTPPKGSSFSRPLSEAHDGIDGYARHILDARFRERNAPHVPATVGMLAKAAPKGWAVMVDWSCPKGGWVDPFDTTPTSNATAFASKDAPESCEFAQVWITSPDGNIVFVTTVEPSGRPESWGANRPTIVVGHNTFNTTKGWRTYTRRGHDLDSLDYPYDKPYSLKLWEAAFADAAKRAVEGIARVDEAVPVPGTRWTLPPSKVEEVKAKLASGGSHTWTPASMGQGERYSKRPSSRYDRRADPKTEEWSGVSPLWIQTLDCD
jgi:hypothetical protein